MRNKKHTLTIQITLVNSGGRVPNQGSNRKIVTMHSMQSTSSLVVEPQCDAKHVLLLDKRRLPQILDDAVTIESMWTGQ